MLPPENYWTNTSGNDVLKHFIESAGAAKGLAKTDLERLVNGEIVEKDIREDLTYNELYASMDNLWSTLFMAGYLTHKGRVDTIQTCSAKQRNPEHYHRAGSGFV